MEDLQRGAEESDLSGIAADRADLRSVPTLHSRGFTNGPSSRPSIEWPESR